MSPPIRPIAAWISLALCIACLALWIHTQFFSDQLFWTRAAAPTLPDDNLFYGRFATMPAVALSQFRIAIDQGCLTIARAHLSTWDNPDTRSPTFTIRGRPTTPGFEFYQSGPGGAVLATTSDLQVAGFSFSLNTDRPYYFYSSRSSVDETELTVPFWALALALFFFALPFKCWVDHLDQRAKSRIGCCKICGYDLRASTERCPECGTPIPLRPSRRCASF